jgi:hypothetical protein
LAAKLSLVKKIVNNETISVFNLLINTIFGGRLPDFYDENKVYNKGDFVLKQEDDNISILVATKDNITGPFNEDYFSNPSFKNLFKDSSLLLQNNTTFNNVKEAISDDLCSLVHNLAGLIDTRLVLNTIYRENFKTIDNILIVKGIHEPGSIQSFLDGLEFKLKKIIELKTEPTKFKLQHYIELQGTATLGCSITFNALDKEPYWFNANDALLSDGFFEIPINDFEKEKNVPYAMDIKIYGEIPKNSFIKISDLMVVFI